MLWNSEGRIGLWSFAFSIYDNYVEKWYIRVKHKRGFLCREAIYLWSHLIRESKFVFFFAKIIP